MERVCEKMKIKTIKKITGKICVQTGMRIEVRRDHGNRGVDNPILRNPSNNEPYIPGSSLKGKMRR